MKLWKAVFIYLPFINDKNFECVSNAVSSNCPNFYSLTCYMFVKGQVKRKCNFVFHGQNIGNLSAEPSDTSIKSYFETQKWKGKFTIFSISNKSRFKHNLG